MFVEGSVNFEMKSFIEMYNVCIYKVTLGQTFVSVGIFNISDYCTFSLQLLWLYLCPVS